MTEIRPLPPEVPRWKTIVGIILVLGAVAAGVSLAIQMIGLILR